MNGVIHQADEPVGLKQLCRDCGEVLSDYENCIGVGVWRPAWWQGTVTVHAGNQQRYTIAGAEEGAIPCNRKVA